LFSSGEQRDSRKPFQCYLLCKFSFESHGKLYMELPSDPFLERHTFPQVCSIPERNQVAASKQVLYAVQHTENPKAYGCRDELNLRLRLNEHEKCKPDFTGIAGLMLIQVP